jgi:hypothetical protein
MFNAVSKARPHLVAAASLTAAVALMAVTAVADPAIEEGAGLADSIRNAAASVTIAALATIALAVLLAVGVVALLLVVRGRGRWLIVAASLLTVLGAPGFILDATIELSMLDLARSDLDAAAVASVAAVLEGGTAETLAFLGILMVWVGLLLLPASLWRAGLIPAWLAALLLLATLVEPPAHRLKAAHIVVHLVLLAGYAAAAHLLWRAGPASFDSHPEAAEVPVQADQSAHDGG